MCDNFFFLKHLFRAIFSLDVLHSKDLLFFGFFWLPHIFAHNLIEALFLCNKVLLFNIGQKSHLHEKKTMLSRCFVLTSINKHLKFFYYLCALKVVHKKFSLHVNLNLTQYPK